MTTADIGDTGKNVAETVGAGVEAAAIRAEEASRSVRERLRSARETATNRVHRFQDAAIDTVTRRPGWTIATAVLIGTTIGFLAGKNRRGH